MPWSLKIWTFCCTKRAFGSQGACGAARRDFAASRAFAPGHLNHIAGPDPRHTVCRREKAYAARLGLEASPNVGYRRPGHGARNCSSQNPSPDAQNRDPGQSEISASWLSCNLKQRVERFQVVPGHGNWSRQLTIHAHLADGRKCARLKICLGDTFGRDLRSTTTPGTTSACTTRRS